MLTCERVLARARKGKILGKSKSYRRFTMSTARKEAIQKNAKAKKTTAKALKIIKPTKAVKQGNEIIADPLAGGVTATVNRYFESATTLGKAGETATAIMMVASGWQDGKRVKKGDALREALLKKLHSNLETLQGRPLQNLKKNIKATQRLFNKKTVQDRLLGKERSSKVYFGGLNHLIDRDLITQEQIESEGLKQDEYCFTTIKEKEVKKDLEDLSVIIGDWIERMRAEIPCTNPNQVQKDFLKETFKNSIATIKTEQERYKV
jgi:hypothetical protein